MLAAFDVSTLLFSLKKLLASMLLPPLLPLLMVLAGLLLLKRHRRSGLALAWSGLLVAFVSSSPFTVGHMLLPLEATPPVTDAQLQKAEVIVVLAGGKRSFAPEYGGETVSPFSLERLRYGARLARQTGLPMLLSGGLPDDGLSEAELMAEALQTDFGIEPRWIESRSRDTRENALYSAQLLLAAGHHHVVLVTHSSHMPRAEAEFRAHGLLVTPAPTAWLGNRNPDSGFPPLLPNANSTQAGWYASHEWLGRLFYQLKPSNRN